MDYKMSHPHLIWVDPERIRFQHSRIRPYFSGCGRSLLTTLQSIRDGEIGPTDLPPIQVLVGATAVTDTQPPWYFALNNRRLWVLKRCREEGLLPNNQILVRVRSPKSQAERDRYTLANCVVEAKLLRDATSATTTVTTGFVPVDITSTQDTAGTTAISKREVGRRSATNNTETNHHIDVETFGESNRRDTPANPSEYPCKVTNDDEDNDDDDDSSDGNSLVQNSNPFNALR